MADLVRLRRLSGVFLAAALTFGCAVAFLDVPPAAAQGFSFLNNLFGGGAQRPSTAPAYPGSGYGDGSETNNYYSAPRRHAPRKKRPVVEQAQEQPNKAPTNATMFVDVYGDSMGQLLANGLEDALADRPEVGVVRKAKGSTGLVTTSFYDWPKVIDDQLGIKEAEDKDADTKDKQAKEQDAKGKDGKENEAKTKETKKDVKNKDVKNKDAKDKDAKDKDAKGKDAKDKATKDKAPKDKIDVAVMMIGINDRQTIVEDGKKLAPGSDEWTAAYRKRVLAIAEAFAKKKIPLIWVGIPITKDDNFADDMAAQNEIYREVAAKTGATYVDTWEAFSDDNGDFAAFGPDINGQVVRLRAEDGIHFTKAGSRKLAHFVEAHVRRDLDGKAPLPQLPTAEAPSSDDKKKSAKPAVAAVKPEAGPIKNLVEAPSAKDGRLTEVPKDTSVANYAAKEKPEGSAAAPAGRADDFRWPSAGSPPQP